MRLWTAALVALLALTGCRSQASDGKPKPDLYVLTSLPLVFDEGFVPGPAMGEAAVFLRERYTLKPIDLPSQLPKGAVLLAAQPRALPAEELVALDKWVRGGGRLVLLADPLLEWSSERALGDRLRPPVSFADTGLLTHWGLRLDAPEARGLSNDRSTNSIAFLSPGILVKIGGDCAIYDDGWNAVCRLGKGEAVVIADADVLNLEAIREADGHPTGNLRAIDSLIAPPVLVE